jgi:hypothetical protein
MKSKPSLQELKEVIETNDKVCIMEATESSSNSSSYDMKPQQEGRLQRTKQAM